MQPYADVALCIDFEDACFGAEQYTFRHGFRESVDLVYNSEQNLHSICVYMGYPW